MPHAAVFDGRDEGRGDGGVVSEQQPDQFLDIVRLDSAAFLAAALAPERSLVEGGIAAGHDQARHDLPFDGSRERNESRLTLAIRLGAWPSSRRLLVPCGACVVAVELIQKPVEQVVRYFRHVSTPVVPHMARWPIGGFSRP